MRNFALVALAAAMSLATAAQAAPAVLKVPVPKLPGAAVADYDCKDEMGYLRIIRRDELLNHQFASVWVLPICEGEDAGSIRSSGNATGLRTTIAGVPMMAAALDSKDYSANDVVGVLFGGNNSLYLYVHKD